MSLICKQLGFITGVVFDMCVLESIKYTQTRLNCSMVSKAKQLRLIQTMPKKHPFVKGLYKIENYDHNRRYYEISLAIADKS